MAGEPRLIKDSAQTVVNHASNVATSNVAGGAVTFDNSTKKYPRALATLYIADFSAAPSAGAYVNLLAVRQDVDGTSDDTSAPSGTSVESAEILGAWPIYAVDEAQRVTIDIDLRGAEKALVWIENRTGATINAGSGTEMTVKITPYSFEPTP